MKPRSKNANAQEQKEMVNIEIQERFSGRIDGEMPTGRYTRPAFLLIIIKELLFRIETFEVQ
jgi:hypothetical protein